MRFEGTIDIAAPRSRVWDFLVDPERIAACAPDIQELQVTDPRHFSATVRAGIGPIRSTFAFDVAFDELRERERGIARASGRAAGSRVEMTSTFELSDASAGHTSLRWTSDVTVSGAIANVGARFLPAAADKTTREVFACVKDRLERAGDPAPSRP